MKISIIRPDYTSLWNSEFPGAVKRTVAIAEKFEIEEMHLEKSFNELKLFVPQLANIKINTQKSEKIEEIGQLDNERDTLIKAAVKLVQSLDHVQLPEVKHAHDILANIFEKHQAWTIPAANYASETERINLLEEEFRVNEDAQEAATSFGLEPLFQRLFIANREYEVLFRDYIADKSSEQNIDIPALRSNCSKALGQFFDEVQYCAYKYEDVDYLPLINELNTLNGYYRTRLKARATRRKNNRADKGETIPPPPEV